MCVCVFVIFRLRDFFFEGKSAHCAKGDFWQAGKGGGFGFERPKLPSTEFLLLCPEKSFRCVPFSRVGFVFFSRFFVFFTVKFLVFFFVVTPLPRRKFQLLS